MTDLLTANDRSGAHAPSWYAASTELPPPNAPLTGPIVADVAVIGAGLTGLSAALHLAEAGYDVVVLEAHRVGWGASGRNGGQLCTGFHRDQDEIEALLGRATAHALWRLGLQAKALVHELVARHGIDCGYAPGVLHAAHRRRYVPAYRAYAAKLRDEYGYQAIRFVDADEIRSLVASPRYFGGTLDLGAGHLQPLAYVTGLARAAAGAGARLLEGTRVLGLRAEGAAVTVETAGGRVRAGHVVLATNGYLDGLVPEIADRIMPINNFVVATAPLGEATADALIPCNAAVADSRFVVNYFRRTPDHRLLFGGGESYGYRFPANIVAKVRPRLEHVLPQLRGVAITHGWGGTLAITPTRLPCFRRIGNRVLFAGGFSGQGLALGTLAGQLTARAIGGDGGAFDVLASLPHRPFPGGRHMRWPLLVLAMTFFGLRDRV